MQSINKYKVTGLERQLKELRCLLEKIYKDHPVEELNSMWSQLLQILEANRKSDFSDLKSNLPQWDSSTVVLITYADGVYSSTNPTLKPLEELIDKHLDNLASIIHLLPFLCSTSDGGFAVSSYEKIEPRFGEWDDLKRLSKNHILMADLVLNHISASHQWVQQFKKSKEPGKKYILAPINNDNWSNVIRPRNSSLFTAIATKDGKKDVWTTFGPDQIDINWR